LCSLISETVSQCGTIWERCHTQEEVRRLKDTQLEALMLQYSEVDQKSCGVVTEYLDSGRQEANRQGMRCSDGQSLAAQRRFGGCSHDISDEAYSKMEGEYEGDEQEQEQEQEQEEQGKEEKEKDMEDMGKVLCDTLLNIGKTCMKELQVCFRRDDVVRTTTNHLESMKGFLINIAGKKVHPGALDSCNAAEQIDFGPEEEVNEEEDYGYDYSEEEDEEEASEAREEAKAMIEAKLSEERQEQQGDEPSYQKEAKKPEAVTKIPPQARNSKSVSEGTNMRPGLHLSLLCLMVVGWVRQ